MNAKTPTPTTTSETNIYGGIATADPRMHALLVQAIYGLDGADHDVPVDYLRDLISEVSVNVIFENGRAGGFGFARPLAQMTEEDLANVAERLDELRGQLDWHDLTVPCDGVDDVDHVDGIDCEPEHWKRVGDALDLDSDRVYGFARARRDFCERHNLVAVLPA